MNGVKVGAVSCLLRLSQYDATEVDPCRFIDGDRELVERCTSPDEGADMWSVYLHLKTGGVECIADCQTEEDALLIAAAIDHFAISHGRKDWIV